jgi:hypothetical protein
LPDDGLPLNIQLYVDKSVASSFGTKKLYPVIARLANLPRDIRNGNGIGGGRVVGLIPVVNVIPFAESALINSMFQVEEKPEGLPDNAFANFKCEVWHHAVGKLLQTIKTEAHLGHAINLEQHSTLGLGKMIWRLFPSVTILSADYEEQYVLIQSPCSR